MSRFTLPVSILAIAMTIAAGCGGGSGGTTGASSTSTTGPSNTSFSASQLSDPGGDWLTNGGTLDNARYSSLDEINTSNVADLKGEWMANLGSGNTPKYSAEATPVEYNGVVYVVTGADDVFAYDVGSGDLKWKYEANLDKEITTVCCGWTSRGVAIGDGKVYVGQLDGKLVALDMNSGKKVWDATVGKWQDGETVTGAPLYYDGKVYSGVSGGEFGVRARVTAYDSGSGKELWKFYTTPAAGEPGSDTWAGDSWKHGGAPVWQTPAVDPSSNTLYFSTGNTNPDFDGSKRAGDNLYTDSVVAIDAKTGTYKWHFQEVHHDIWDYDAPSPVVLFDVKVNGTTRHALGSPSKTGWVYILDRDTGKPLIGIDERPVPQNAKQNTSKTQPFPKGDAFVPQSITASDAAAWKKANPSEKWTYTNGGNIFTPFWGQGGIIGKPGTLGGDNWPPSSFDPQTGYLYVCASDSPSTFTSSEAKYDPNQIKQGTELLGSAFGGPKAAPMKGTITAMDVSTNTIAWQKQLTAADEHGKNVPANCYSGAVSTAGGIVFVGYNDGTLRALDAKNGNELWSFQTGAGANAPVSVFEWKGHEYVAFYAGGSSLGGTAHGDNFWLFSLQGQKGPAPAPNGLSEARSQGALQNNQPQNKPETGVKNPSTTSTSTTSTTATK